MSNPHERKVFELRVIDPARAMPGVRNTYEITIQKPAGFSFSAGQSMKFFPNDTEGSSFSIVTSPEQEFLTFVFRGSDSPLKRRMLSLRCGDTVPLRDVKREGDTFHYPDAHEKDVPVVMLASGVGITPCVSMLRHAEHIHDSRAFTLLYSNPTVKDVAFKDEINATPSYGVNLTARYFLTQEEKPNYERGYFTEEKLAPLFKEPLPIFYVVGPEKMVLDTVETLKKIGVPDTHVRFKKFTGYTGEDDVNRA